MINTAISNLADIKYEIIVVDNSITPREINHAKLVHTGSNLGYCGGNNIGVKYSASNYLLFVNPDVIFFNPTLFNMFLDTNVGQISGTVNTNEPTAAFPIDRIYDVNELGYYGRKQLPNDWVYGKYVDGHLLGCYREDFDSIGGFDENIFPGYGSEIAFCFDGFLKGILINHLDISSYYKHDWCHRGDRNYSLMAWDVGHKGRDCFYQNHAIPNWDKFLEYMRSV